MNGICTTKIVLCTASKIEEAKLLENIEAGVAKLVDARDLKFVRNADSKWIFCTTHASDAVKYDAKSFVLHTAPILTLPLTLPP